MGMGNFLRKFYLKFTPSEFWRSWRVLCGCGGPFPHHTLPENAKNSQGFLPIWEEARVVKSFSKGPAELQIAFW